MPGHSSIITMKLRTDNRVFEVVQSGGDFLDLSQPESFPAGPAEFEISIDGEVTRRQFLVEQVDNSIKVYPQTSAPAASPAMVAEP